MSRINLASFEHKCAERGKTVSEMAKIAGLSSSTLAKIRRGDEVTVKTLEKLDHALNSIAVRPGIAELLQVAS